ncbi:hypothetical protein DFP82_103203 [Psychrobacter fozii]|uniref:Uncharacterized protein n=1 Tax=Psychrobacter fozii TaxID=198480 RepID=A0A2V4VLK7_9GAMM|nr:hypothetical protein DFP82_103203 [Psychrobacter fozii]
MLSIYKNVAKHFKRYIYTAALFIALKNKRFNFTLMVEFLPLLTDNSNLILLTCDRRYYESYALTVVFEA